MPATRINLSGLYELDITGITGTSISNGIVSFTIPSSSTSPGGSSGDIQYNNSGAFGGFADGTSHQVLHGGKTYSAVDLASDVAGLLPYASISGTPTLAQTITNVTHKWLNSYNATTGTFTQTQPTDADISFSNITTGNVSITAHGYTPILPNDATKFLDGTGAYSVPPGTATGTVTSVAITVPAEFSVSGSPVTTSGSFTITKATETANTVWAGPTTGSAAQPTFRSLVAADIPNLPASIITSGQLALARGGTNSDLSGTGGTSQVLKQTSVGGSVTVAQLNYTDITGTNPTPPSGAVLWSALGNAGGALTLSNAGNASTFNHTSGVNWIWANTTAATSSVSQSSPIVNLNGTYWTGAASAATSFSLQNSVTNGTNGACTLVIDQNTGPTSSGANPVLQLLSSNGLIKFGTVQTAQVNVNSGLISCVDCFSSGGNGFRAASAAFFFWLNRSEMTSPSDGNIKFTNHAENSFGLLQLGGTTSSFPAIKRSSAEIAVRLADDSANANLQVAKISNYNAVATISNGVPAEYATVDLTAQSAAVTATTLYAVPAAGVGMYRVSVYAKITTAASISSVLGGTNGFQVGFTDSTDSVAQTIAVIDLTNTSLSANSTTTIYIGSAVIMAKASTNITYAFDFTSAGVTSMQYTLRVKLEAM